MKHMCLACGRYFSTEDPRNCPYCGDVYLTNNILPDAPPPLFEGNQIITLSCGHSLSTDIPGDVRFCPICGIKVSVEGYTLKEWQDEQMVIRGI